MFIFNPWKNFTLVIVLISLSLASTSQVQAETPVAQGKLKFAGELIAKDIKVKPEFWFRDEDHNSVPSPQVEYKNGIFEVRGLPPGRYLVAVNLDTNQLNPVAYPGDLRGNKKFSVEKGRTTFLDVNLSTVIHMLNPEDNGKALPKWEAECEDHVTFKAPLKFAWEPVHDGAYYDYTVTKATCKPFSFGTAVTSGTIQDNSIELELPQSNANEMYILRLTARKDGNEIGSLMTHGGSGGYGWDYRFRVR